VPPNPSLAPMVDVGDGHATIQELEDLYRHRYRRFLRLAIAITGSAEAAADAVQEGFAHALRSRHELRSRGALEAWVWRMVMNAAIDQRRLRPAADVPAELPTQDEAYRPELREAVAALPDRQRQTLFLRHYADLSYEEIAEVLGVARGTVAATLHAAHQALRAKLPEVAA
jgi:RNA polymerase sigma-70 factor (ECF subfamily)